MLAEGADIGDALNRLGPRAFAAFARRFVLPFELWLREGAYGPFVAIFSRACDAAEPWYALGHDPHNAPKLELDAVEGRGTAEERKMWSVLWSISRAMEVARRGDLSSARSQFLFAVKLVRDSSPGSPFGEAARQLLKQGGEYVARAAESASLGADPPLDCEALVSPGFTRSDPTPWEDHDQTRQSNLAESTDFQPLSFEDEIESLMRLVRSGSVAFFCGAGISIASGLPSAHALKSALLRQLPASEVEVEWLLECDYPFEAFLEVFLGPERPEQLLKVFGVGEPSAAHELLAELVARGALRTIVTTNFDELIERALAARQSSCRVAWQPEDLAALATLGEEVRVIKLHGTSSVPESMALVMEQVAGRRHVESRERAIRMTFSDGRHEAVLVLGYSCSDWFDISPAIEALGPSAKHVYIVQHECCEPHAEDIRIKRTKNPFRRCARGTRLVCDTDYLFERLSRAITGCGFSARSLADEKWRALVDRWWSQFPRRDRPRVGHHILGLVWYKCGDYRAAKAHFRAALAGATPRVVFHHGVDFLEGLGMAVPSVPPAEYCEALLRVGGCHRALSEYPDAMRRFREAEAVARHSGEKELEAGASSSVGTVLFNTGEFASAARCHEHSAQIWRDLGGPADQLGPCLANLGNAYGAMGRLEEALSSFQEGIELAREIGDKMGEGSRLGGLAQVHRLRGDWSAAAASSRAALQIAERLGDRSGIAHQLGSLALVKAAQGDLTGAIQDGIRASEIFQELGDRQGQARILGNLGADFLSAGRIDAGVECNLRSLEIASGIRDVTVLSNAASRLEQVIQWMVATGASPEDGERATSMIAEYREGRGHDIRPLEVAIGRLLNSSGYGSSES